MAKRILILDDSELIVSMLTMVCTQLGYDVITAASLDEVSLQVAQHLPDAILSDLNLPDTSDPVAALRAMPELSSKPIVLLSGIPQAELERVAEERGADAAISKDAGLPGMMTLLGPTLSILLA